MRHEDETRRSNVLSGPAGWRGGPPAPGPGDDPDGSGWTAPPDDGGAARAVRATRFPVLRAVASEALAALDDDAFAAEFGLLSGLPAPEMEARFAALGRAVVGPAARAPRGGPSMMLGPSGRAVGAGLGRGLALLCGADAAPSDGAGTHDAAACARLRRDAVRGAAPAGTAAAAQMLGRLLTRPEVIESLMSAMLGRAGRAAVRIGGVRVPADAVVASVAVAAGGEGVAAGLARDLGDEAEEVLALLWRTVPGPSAFVRALMADAGAAVDGASGRLDGAGR